MVLTVIILQDIAVQWYSGCCTRYIRSVACHTLLQMLCPCRYNRRGQQSRQCRRCGQGGFGQRNFCRKGSMQAAGSKAFGDSGVNVNHETEVVTGYPVYEASLFDVIDSYRWSWIRVYQCECCSFTSQQLSEANGCRLFRAYRLQLCSSHLRFTKTSLVISAELQYVDYNCTMYIT